MHLYRALVGNRRNIDDIIRRIDIQTIQYYICQTAYLINESELGARVSNFLDDISDLSPNDLDLRENEDTAYEAYCRCSPTFDDLYYIYNVYAKLEEFTPVSVKRQFAKTYIKNFWAKQTPIGRSAVSLHSEDISTLCSTEQQ